MSAGTLRRAAALMRERAEAATAPRHPWALDEDGTAVRARRGAGPTVVTTVPLGHEERRANAEHIASWHPAVALAVADWLDGVAADVDKRDNPQRVGGRFEALRIPDESDALNVARAYLGESA